MRAARSPRMLTKRVRTPLLMLALAAACGAAPAASTSTGNTVGHAPEAPSPYAAIFEAGRRWTFDVVSEHDDGGEASTEELIVECWVEDVTTADGYTTATVACGDAPMGGAPFVGEYTMGPEGLWEGEVDGAPVIAATPETYQHEDQQPPENGGGVDGLELLHTDGTWCVHHYWSGGDGGDRQICVAADLGFISGHRTFDGGASYSASYTLRDD